MPLPAGDLRGRAPRSIARLPDPTAVRRGDHPHRALLAHARTVDDVDALFRDLRERGLRTPGDPAAPTEVHEGPIDQTWGTRELYVDDPDGNTLRFVQG